MPIPLDQLVAALRIERTVLLFGSGSSIPSGAPSVDDIIRHLSTRFRFSPNDLTLPEITDIIEKRHDRRSLVSAVRELFENLTPTGGLLNIPKFRWQSIYTTNYDELIEQAFERNQEPLAIYSSNFDFGISEIPGALRLMKLHGTIAQDISDGHKARLIVSETDYGLTEEFREYIYDSLKRDLAGSDLLIVGHSLADPHVREIISRAISISQKTMNSGSVYLLMYSQNFDRAELHESRGLKVCFAGIDEFAAALNLYKPAEDDGPSVDQEQFDIGRHLLPITIDVNHSLHLGPNVSEMYNGWPASYGDISAGNTFIRSVVSRGEASLLNSDKFGVIILGAGGVGKTTAARQLLVNLTKRHICAWEHRTDYRLFATEWVNVAKRLESQGMEGALFVDEADSHLFEINSLFESLSANDLTSLKVILAAPRNRWYPRIKSPSLFTNGKAHQLERLDTNEISRLLQLINNNRQISSLVDANFIAFSLGEQRRRLEERCERDMFVCLKNIFASEKFDDIILREYATLEPQYQEIYKVVAALESSGVRVHRQLIIRLLSIEVVAISSVLDNLAGIVKEYTLSERDGIYCWRGRHGVIMDIIAEYKFAESEDFYGLYERVIEALNPTYEIEIRTLRELSTVNSGIRRLPDREQQNRLLAKMISVAPGERVPRHRMIRNLIDIRKFEQAETEIRLFTKDFGEDGPVYRYRVILALERARGARGLLEEDRLVILERARVLAVNGARRYPANKNMLSTYCEVGVEVFKRTKSLDAFDDAIKKMKEAEETIGDPEISSQIAYYERRMEGIC